MATTQPGGIYLAADGETYTDANGQPVEPPAEVEKKAKKGKAE